MTKKLEVHKLRKRGRIEDGLDRILHSIMTRNKINLLRNSFLVASILITLAVIAAPGYAGEPLWKQLPSPAPMPKATKSGYAPVNGIKMYYATYGDGQPVILLHGGLGNADYWGNQVPELAKHFRVIVADSRGHGRSTRTPEAFSYDLMASDVLALMDYLKIKKADIVGWSDGGIIGLDIAIHHPERLNRLYAFGANYNTSALRAGLEQNATFNKYIEKAGKDYQRLSKTPGQYDAFLGAISKMWSTQPDFSKKQLQSITAPTLIADGQYDEAIKRSHTEEMAELIPDAQLLILPGVSHFAMWQNPEEFNCTLINFLLTFRTENPRNRLILQ